MRKRWLIFLTLCAMVGLIGCGEDKDTMKLLDEKINAVESVQYVDGVFVAFLHENENVESPRVYPYVLRLPGCF